MSSTQVYLRKPLLAAAFALAIPLYANADLLPPPASVGEKSNAGYQNAGPNALRSLANCTGPGCQPASNNAEKPGGGQNSAGNQASRLAAANGGRGTRNNPVSAELANNPGLPNTGAGNDFGIGSGSEGGSDMGSGDLDMAGVDETAVLDFGAPLLQLPTDYLTDPRNYVVAVRGGNPGNSGDDTNSGSDSDSDSDSDSNSNQELQDELFTTAQNDPITSPDLPNSTVGGDNLVVSNEFSPEAQQALAVPAPGTLLLLGAGLLALGSLRLRSK